MGLQLDTVFIWVTDIDASIGWYETMGLPAGPRHGPWQTIDVDGETRFALHEGDRAANGSTAVPSFRVADLDGEIRRLATVGITPIDDEITDNGMARFTTFADPDGNEIQLLER